MDLVRDKGRIRLVPHRATWEWRLFLCDWKPPKSYEACLGCVNRRVAEQVGSENRELATEHRVARVHTRPQITQKQDHPSKPSTLLNNAARLRQRGEQEKEPQILIHGDRLVDSRFLLTGRRASRSPTENRLAFRVYRRQTESYFVVTTCRELGRPKVRHGQVYAVLTPQIHPFSARQADESPKTPQRLSFSTLSTSVRFHDTWRLWG